MDDLFENIHGTKKCLTCKKHLSVTDFPRNAGTKDHRGSSCRECSRIYCKKHYRKHRDRYLLNGTKHYRENASAYREANLRKSYGITHAQFVEIVERQNGVCMICQKGPSEVDPGKRLAVDHCHHTGIIRGVLCAKCNTAIGQLGHDYKRICRAAAYVGSNGKIEVDRQKKSAA